MNLRSSQSQKVNLTKPSPNHNPKPSITINLKESEIKFDKLLTQESYDGNSDSSRESRVSESSSDGDFQPFEDCGVEYDEEETYEDPNLIGKFDWKAITRNSSQKWLKDYKIKSGPQNLNLRWDSPPISFFQLLFPEELVENLRLWTNTKAMMQIDNRQRKKNKMKKWFPMKAEDEEMSAFIGCLVAMGIAKLPSIKYYWSGNSRLFSICGIQDLFSRTRFMDIYTNLTLRNLERVENGDTLFKIRPIIDSVISASQFYYLLKGDLSLDEAMIPFQGRHSLIQYLPLKPIKYGFKAFLLCEAETGYVLNWRMYDKSIEGGELGVTYKIVKQLCEGFEGEGYRLFMDRYYTSIQLFVDLKELQIGACGTIMINRTFLTKEDKEKIEKLQDRQIHYFKSSNDLLLSCWKDSKTVLVLSNYHGTEKNLTTRRIRKQDLKKRNEKREARTQEDASKSL